MYEADAKAMNGSKKNSSSPSGRTKVPISAFCQLQKESNYQMKTKKKQE